MKDIRGKILISDRGLTLVELLMAMAIVGVVMGAIFYTFKSQQDSYLVQGQVASMQQNLRAAMYFIANDIQMAGFYASIDKNRYSMDWDPTVAGNENIQPRIYGRDNDADGGGNDVRDGTDLILIVKASDDRGTLAAGEGASAGSNQITLIDLDLDNDGDDDLNAKGKKYGILINSDLSRAEFFVVQATGAHVAVGDTFSETYAQDDIIARADIIVYKVNEDAEPALERRNLGQDSGFQIMAEDISDLQFRYQLASGTWLDDPSGKEGRIRQVQVTLTSGVTISEAAGSKQRTLTSTIKVRNLGISLS